MLQTAYLRSDFGCFQIKGSPFGIRSVQRVEEADCREAPVPEALEDCMMQLEAYFRGARQEFDLPLDWGPAAEFHELVWKAVLAIPYGKTSTYSKIAEKIGHPKAVRAVGLANRNNPIAIIIPCHRVIAKNGGLQGYFYGLGMKRRLLELENPMSFARQATLF